MNILQQKWNFLHATLESVPKKVVGLYLFGCTCFVFKNIKSFRANARLLDLNWHTAKSKAYRLAGNRRLLDWFPSLMTTLHRVGAGDSIAIDFSDFHGFQVLMFAKQTGRGRAIPVYFEILAYPIQKDSQNTFIIRAIKHFVEHIDFRPPLVFDRGFACPSIIQFLAKTKHPFIIRIKAKKMVEGKAGKFFVKDATEHDFRCLAYGKRLRIVVSDIPVQGEPWYLVTNDFDSSRKKIIDAYYHRFEIEEFFRDAKRLLGMETIRCKRVQSLSMLLWFLMLGLWFLWNLEEKETELTLRNHMRLSRVRSVFEMLQREIFQATEEPFLEAVLRKEYV